MSLYNLLFGHNPNSDIILAILELKKSDIERFRNCGFTDDGIYIYTRTGGGNRESYPNEKLINSKYYISDEDEEYDCTYATYYFSIPDEIKEDIEKFKDFMNQGITAKFIKWICKTLEREETENDKYHRLWEQQRKLISYAKSINICESNGHTVIPLDDKTTEKLLEMMEEVDGDQLCYSVKPYKIKIEESVKRWEGIDKDKSDLESEMCRVKISFEDNWEVDEKVWERWKTKFSEKYPKAISKIEKELE